MIRPPITKATARQRCIADRAGPWTKPDYRTSAWLQAIDTAWVRGSQWSKAEWLRKHREQERRRAKQGKQEAEA